MILGFCVLFTKPAYALEVNAVRFGISSEKTRLVLELDQASDFRTFMLDNPYRLVVDLPTFNWNAGVIQKSKQAGVLDVRQGTLQPEYSRIVFDLSRAVTIKTAFFLPKDGLSPHKIVIDYTPSTPETFLAKKNKIFGNLVIAQTSASPATALPPPVPLPKPPEPDIALIEETPAVPNEYKPLIVIDPGHGGIDPGAIGSNKTYEKDVVLAIGKDLKRTLLATGRYRVEMTREKDIFIKLRDRVSYARTQGADLFISIHADSTPHKDTRGASVYTLSQKASDEQTAKLAEKENSADLVAGVNLNIEDEQVAYILGDFLMTDTMNQSKFFANTLVKTMKRSKMSLLADPHRFAGFAVLKAPDIPSILLEAGFMSNNNEANLLKQEAHRKKLTAAITNGINAYFEQVQRNEIGE